MSEAKPLSKEERADLWSSDAGSTAWEIEWDDWVERTERYEATVRAKEARIAELERRLRKAQLEAASACGDAAKAIEEQDKRGEILDDIQAEAGATSWRGAIYHMRGQEQRIAELEQERDRLRAQVARVQGRLCNLRDAAHAGNQRIPPPIVAALVRANVSAEALGRVAA